MKLPINCTAEHINNFLTKEESKDLFKQLTNEYNISELRIKTMDGKSNTSDFGKITFIDQNLNDANKFPELLWGKTEVLPETLILIKNRVEKIAKMIFHVCVCIYYPDGNSGVSYHSDYPAFGDTTVIPSLSIGEEREFNLREKTTMKEHSILLEEGSLIIMGEHCQDRYEHSLPTNPIYKNPRINLTFRKYGY